MTNTNAYADGKKTATADSRIVSVKIWSSAETPRMITQPISSNYIFGAQDEALAMNAEATVNRGELSYQWFSSETGSYDESAEIPDATSGSYVPDISRRGERFYYCEVTNVDTTASEDKLSVVRSKMARISIDYDYEGFEFAEIDDSTCKLTAYTGTSLRPYIPDTDSGGRMVVEIGQGVFANSSIVEVTVPDTVETLGRFNAGSNSEGVFAGCFSLQKINFNGHFKYVGDFTFNNCKSLQADTWSYLDRVESIGRGVFESMYLPEKLVFPATLTGSLGDWNFQNCKGVKEITFAGDKVNRIDGSVFANISTLESVVFPASVVSLGDCLKNSANIRSVTFERSVSINGSITTGNPFGTTEYGNLVIHVPADSYDRYVSGLGAYGKFVKEPEPELYTLTVKGAKLDGKNTLELYAHDKLDASSEVVYDDEVNCLGWLYDGGYYEDYAELAQNFTMPYGNATVSAIYEKDFTAPFTPSCKAENYANYTDFKIMAHEKAGNFTGTRYKWDSKQDIKIINNAVSDGGGEKHGEEDGVFNHAPLYPSAKSPLLMTFVNNTDEQITIRYEVEFWGVQGSVTVALQGKETRTGFIVSDPVAKATGSTPYHQLRIVEGGDTGYDITIYGRLPVERSEPVLPDSGVGDITFGSSDFAAMKFTDGGYSMKYRVHVPDAIPASGCAVVMFYHGAGECGDDNAKQITTYEGFKYLFEEENSLFADAVVIAPQCPTNEKWVNVANWSDCVYSTENIPESDPMKASMKILNYYTENYNIDEKRIYAMGLSMGGYATWDALVRHNDIFAAGVPICGGCDTSKADVLVNTSVWMFHGTADGTVPCTGTDSMYELLQGKGNNNAKYTKYEGQGHAIWNDAMKTDGLGEWLFSSEKYSSPQTA